ncbi:hypothetical protein [Chishuiella sp.]|uniref:hypothetical protein n=1 Tax=Chishuiella sp. TaxID=1969467 RepID=UPI0028AAB271|nr:hypothetical protein [Chishuiella sp.]
MKKNDPIEELFQKRSKESVGEKPRDLVWKRIESGLNTEKKKKRTLREFVSSVWFSAAVFALIAIPYFIFFVENLNTLNQKETIEVVKMDTFPEDQTKIKSNDLEIIEEVEDKNNQPVIIVKDTKKDTSEKLVIHSNKNINKIKPSKDVIVLTEKKVTKKNILDSIENKGLYAVNSRMRTKIVDQKDSLNFKNLDESFAVSSAYYKQRGDKNSQPAQPKTSENIIPSIGESVNVHSDNNEIKIIYKPLKFTAKTKILRTNFKLLGKSKKRVSFVNNSIIICFEKTNNEILLKTNEPNMSFELMDLLEKNKKEIFDYYQSVE